MTSKANEMMCIHRNVVCEVSKRELVLNNSRCVKCLIEELKALTDKFRIIPKIDSPEKHVEIYNTVYPPGVKIKWREDK